MVDETEASGKRSANTLDRLVFFGTPAFAVPTLEALGRSGRMPDLVVSQPTRAAGRGRRSSPPPVAQWAVDHGVDLVQTDKVSAPDFLAMLRQRGPAVAVVVAFGQIFRKQLLALPRFGCINLHASLLPAYRGASPIVAAVRHGEVQTGVTTMAMERGLDSGPILLQRALDIGENETTPEVSRRLSAVGAELVVETLERLESGALHAIPQDHGAATLAPMLDRSDGDLDWRTDALQLHNQVRALVPWPGTRATFRDQPIVIKKTVLGSRSAGRSGAARPGEVLGVDGEALWVAAGDGCVLGLLEVQRPGRRAVSARDFANGEQPQPGELFGSISQGPTAAEEACAKDSPKHGTKDSPQDGPSDDG